MTTSLEDRIRGELPRMASAIESSPRNESRTRTVSSRRKRAALFGLGAVIVFGSGIAVAVRTIPDDVQRSNEQIDEFGGCGRVIEEEARLVATAQRPDGNSLEFWVFPTSSGVVADHVRTVAPDGSVLSIGSGCGSPIDSTWAFASTEQTSGEPDGIIEVRGHINEDAETVLVRFGSGATVVAPVQSDGYFLVSFRGDVLLYDVSLTVEPTTVEPVSG